MIRRSLSLRILLVNFLLLILPLFFYFLIVFHYEYDAEIKKAVDELKEIGESRASLFTEITNSNYKALATVSSLLDIGNPKSLSLDINKKLANFAKVGGFTELNYFVETPYGQYIAEASSNLDKIGKEYTFREYIKVALQTGRSAYLAYHTVTLKQEFYVTNRIISSTDKKTIGALTCVLPATQILDQLVNVEYAPFQSRLSLLTNDGIVFTSSDPQFEMTALYPISEERLIELQKNEQFGPYLIKLNEVQFRQEKGYENVFEWQEGDSTRIGIKIPVNGTDLQIFIDCDKELIANDIYAPMWQLLLLISLSAIVMTLLNLWLTHRLSTPLRQLFNVMHQVGEGEYKKRFVKDPIGYEINDIGQALNDTVTSLEANIESAKHERGERELLAKEFKIGRDIQMSILPQEMPKLEGVEIEARSRPALEVGGDFYDVFLIKNWEDKEGSRLFATIADGAGKGISACLYSLGLRSILRSYAVENLSVGEVSRFANNLFYLDTEKSCMFVTAFSLIFDPKEKRIDYCCSGHSPCIVRKIDGTLLKFTTEGMAMGVDVSEKVIQNSLYVSSGDLVVLYTDGVTDAQNSQGELWGQDRFDEYLKLHGNLPLSTVLNDLYNSIDAFVGEAKQYDDITVIMMRIV